MPSKQELERHDLVELAVMCQKLCDDASVHELIALEAARLKREWIVLVARETPPPFAFQQHPDHYGDQVQKTNPPKEPAD